MPETETTISTRFAVPSLKAGLLFVLAVNLLALARGEKDASVWVGVLVGLCGPAWMLAPILWRQWRGRKGDS